MTNLEKREALARASNHIAMAHTVLSDPERERSDAQHYMHLAALALDRVHLALIREGDLMFDFSHEGEVFATLDRIDATDYLTHRCGFLPHTAEAALLRLRLGKTNELHTGQIMVTRARDPSSS